MDRKPDMLTPEDVAALKHVTPCAVRLAIRQGRLAAVKIVLPPASAKRPGRSVWRIAEREAVAWDAEARQPRAGAVVVDPGPKREGELTVIEAAALKGVTEPALRQAINTNRLAARWAPREHTTATAVPTRGNTNQGVWYIQRSDLLAWRPGNRNAGGSGSRSGMANTADDMTVAEVAALKGVKTNTVRTAIVRGRLPAVWIPQERAEDTEDTRLPRGRGPGRWLIKRSEAEAYARSPKNVPPPRRKPPNVAI